MLKTKRIVCGKSLRAWVPDDFFFLTIRDSLFHTKYSVADPDFQIRGDGHLNPEIKGGPVSKKFFFGPSGRSLV